MQTKDNRVRKSRYLNANTSIHIKGCNCVWAGTWEGLQTPISHPNYSKQAALYSFMTSVIETIPRKTINTLGHSMSLGCHQNIIEWPMGFLIFIILYNQNIAGYPDIGDISFV